MIFRARLIDPDHGRHVAVVDAQGPRLLEEQNRSPSWKKDAIGVNLPLGRDGARLNSLGLGVAVDGGYLRVGRGEQKYASGFSIPPSFFHCSRSLAIACSRVSARWKHLFWMNAFKASSRRLARGRPPPPAAREDSGGE